MTSNWILDILIASIFVTGSYLAIKYASIKANNNIGISERAFIIISLTMGLLAILLIIFFKEIRKNIISDLKNIEVSKWAMLSGLLIFISYFFLFRGSVTSPNLGYARSVLTIDIVMLTVFSAILFGAPISLSSIIGMCLIICGILLVSLYN
jgi:drug/metabolite transporter (DMT)-like permease